jgi:hypothetical protein
VAAIFHDLPLAEHYNTVRPLSRREPMADDDHDAILGPLFQARKQPRARDSCVRGVASWSS